MMLSSSPLTSDDMKSFLMNFSRFFFYRSSLKRLLFCTFSILDTKKEKEIHEEIIKLIIFWTLIKIHAFFCPAT